jgi:hypothetical protein
MVRRRFGERTILLANRRVARDLGQGDKCAEVQAISIGANLAQRRD